MGTSAAVVVGSRARQERGADAWSDLDLVLFVRDAASYQRDARWLDAIGEVWLAVPSRTGRGDPEWLAVFAGGLKADFVFARVAEATQPLAQLLISSPYQFVYERGVRVLLDKNDPYGTHALPAFISPPSSLPTDEEFGRLTQLFLLGATRCARFIARGDLWRAKFLCDGTLKQQLLTMLEWHALATRGVQTDVWHDGRYLDEWADHTALEILPRTFAAFDRADLRRGLFATLELFARLAHETAARQGFAYPLDVERRVTAWMRDALSPTPR